MLARDLSHTSHCPPMPTIIIITKHVVSCRALLTHIQGQRVSRGHVDRHTHGIKPERAVSAEDFETVFF